MIPMTNPPARFWESADVVRRSGVGPLPPGGDGSGGGIRRWLGALRGSWGGLEPQEAGAGSVREKRRRRRRTPKRPSLVGSRGRFGRGGRIGPALVRARGRELLASLAGVLLAGALVGAIFPASAADPAPAPTSASAAVSATPGTIPYRAVAEVFDGFAKVKEKDKLRIGVRIVPAKGHVPTTPLAVEIRSRTGVLPLKLSPTGELVEFPLTPELRAENPKLASNQPKGTLNLRAELSIRYSGRPSEYAAWYLDALGQANAAVKGQVGLMSFVVPKLETLVFEFDPAARATVTLRTEAGEKSVPADAEGKARVRLGPEAAHRSARIVLSAEPRLITAE
jgi:hypothetical protein